MARMNMSTATAIAFAALSVAGCSTDKKSCEQFEAKMKEVSVLATGDALAGASEDARIATELRKKLPELNAIRFEGPIGAYKDGYVAVVESLIWVYDQRLKERLQRPGSPPTAFPDPTQLARARTKIEEECAKK